MGAALPYQSTCCTDCDDPTVQNTPGATGDAGADGADGADGVNAYTTLTAQFTMPAVGANVVATVASTAWMVVGQVLYVQNAGYMEVVTITNSTTVTIKNLEDGLGAYDSNVVAGTVIAIGSKVGPGGTQGPDGTLSGAVSGVGDLDTGAGSTWPNPRLAITATKGDIIVNQNNGTAPRNTALSVGGDGTVLHCDSLKATGLEHRAIDLSGTNTDITGQTPIANGGTGQSGKTAAFDALSPTTTKGDIIAYNGSDNVRLAVGADGSILQADSAQASGVKWAQIGPSNFSGDAEEVTVETIIIRDVRASGTDGDNSSGSAGTWGPADLTEISQDTTAAVPALTSITSGGVTGARFTLTEGYYRISASAPGYQVGYHQIRLKNLTSGNVQPHAGTAYLIYGTTECSPAGLGITTRSHMEGRFQVVNPSEEFCIEHYAELASVSAGYGKAASIASVSEVYCVVRIEKIAKTA